MAEDKPKSIWVDDDGDFSMGRLVAFLGAILGVLVCVAGVLLEFLNAFHVATSSNGVGMVGIGLGIFTSGALLKGWQKQSESSSPKV